MIADGPTSFFPPGKRDVSFVNETKAAHRKADSEMIRSFELVAAVEEPRSRRWEWTCSGGQQHSCSSLSRNGGAPEEVLFCRSCLRRNGQRCCARFGPLPPATS